MIILDTNVISALMRPEQNGQVVAWLDRQPRLSVWTTAINILAASYGLRIMSAGRRRDGLMAAMERLVTQALEGRVLAFDHAAAEAAAALAAARADRGQPIDTHDTQIAGIALAWRATIATRNVRHFDDAALHVVDPWSA
ncbi:type II toxin-antitoxin system VapC family toxin [Methylocapsa sp. S129]|uniref:type II toxin-antitoxin system VapC family toxin n=1 Tax=Methylocapsa sp. S129 TaxID=1641869 RepID=UPI00131B6770|nr:type II toxin-antitoxin system VapC family toxin [Methylocapsa sp. S129]